MKVLIAEDDPVSRRLLQSYLVKWGSGSAAARTRLQSLSSEEFEEIRSEGLTRDMAVVWRDFYISVSRDMPDNPRAAVGQI